MPTNSENSVVHPSAEQYITDANGNKTAVILAIEQYEQLLEDLHDLAVVAERRQEQPISLEEMQRRLSQHALAIELGIPLAEECKVLKQELEEEHNVSNS